MFEAVELAIEALAIERLVEASEKLAITEFAAFSVIELILDDVAILTLVPFGGGSVGLAVAGELMLDSLMLL